MSDDSDLLALRVRRVRSWVECAEENGDDKHICFVFLWVAFSAACEDADRDFEDPVHKVFPGFFREIVRCDDGKILEEAVRSRFYLTIPGLINQKREWLEGNDIAEVLVCIFNRFNDLRNKIFHGNIAWGGSALREPIEDIVSILYFLVPKFADIMEKSPAGAWGVLPYPIEKEFYSEGDKKSYSSMWYSKSYIIRDDIPKNSAPKIRRAASWIKCSERFNDSELRFIFLWIAFNAAYSSKDAKDTGILARVEFREYFRELVDLDKEDLIYNAVWDNFHDIFWTLIDNKYLYEPYWDHYNGAGVAGEWRSGFKGIKGAFESAFRNQDTAKILGFIFKRIYSLRNLVVHGGVTCKGGVISSAGHVIWRLDQDCAAILGILVPRFVEIMKDNPQKDW